MITQKQIDDAVKYANMVPFSERPTEAQHFLCALSVSAKLQKLFPDGLSYDQVEEEKFVPTYIYELGEKYLAFIKLMTKAVAINHGQPLAEDFIHLTLKQSAFVASIGWIDMNSFEPALIECHNIASSGGEYTSEDGYKIIENYLKER